MATSEITFAVSRTQFWGGIIALLLSVATFGFTMRADVTENARVAREALDEAKSAKQGFHSVEVRLARIETMLEQIVKNYGERLVKMEKWRDGPTAGGK